MPEYDEDTGIIAYKMQKQDAVVYAAQSGDDKTGAGMNVVYVCFPSKGHDVEVYGSIFGSVFSYIFSQTGPEGIFRKHGMGSRTPQPYFEPLGNSDYAMLVELFFGIVANYGNDDVGNGRKLHDILDKLADVLITDAVQWADMPEPPPVRHPIFPSFSMN